MSEYRTFLRSLAAGWCESPISQRSANRTVLCFVAALFLLLAVAKGQSPFCLPDADGDGHPLFGNPEFMLNPYGLEIIGMIPTAGAIGDLDADGDIDAVSTYAVFLPYERDATNISVLLNRGDGIFSAESPHGWGTAATAAGGVYECGDYPSSVAIGDVSGDGVNDLAVTNTISGYVSVLINDGVGAFPNRTTYPVGITPRSSVIVDLDGDGDRDLAVCNAGSNSVSILLNQGHGTFGSQATFDVPDVPDESILNFDPLAFGGPWLASGDLDGDGDADLLVPDGGGVTVLMNAGNATFAAPITYPANGPTWGMAAGDLDGDGDADLVTANFATDSFSVLMNEGDAGFGASVDYDVLFNPTGGVYDVGTAALGDLDRDGDLDLALGITSSFQRTLVCYNDGSGGFENQRRVDADGDPRIVDFADLNGDGHLDLAIFALQSPDDKLCVVLNDGSGRLLDQQPNYDVHAPPVPNLWASPRAVAFVDLDHDDDLDIVVANRGLEPVVASVALVENVGGGTFGSSVHVPVLDFYPRAMALGDLNSDGYSDVVVAGPEDFQWTPGRVAVLLNDGAGSLMDPVSYLTGGYYPICVATADVDNDGDIDALAGNYYTGDLSVLLSDGFGTLTALPPEPVDIGIVSIATADLDGDGATDLAMGIELGVSHLALLFGNGDGTFTAGPAHVLWPRSIGVLAADVDDDGDSDVLVSHGNSPQEPTTFTVLMNDGYGSLAVGYSYWAPGTGGAGSLSSFDVDLDSDLDIAVRTNGSISVFTNLGDGTFLSGMPYGVGDILDSTIAIGDLDGDGAPDLAAANAGENTYSILWNHTCQPPIVPRSDIDEDGDVDLTDLRLYLTCLSGPGTGGLHMPCASADLDSDADVDLADFQRLQVEFSGSL